MDLNSKPQSTASAHTLTSQEPRMCIVNCPSLYLSHYPRQLALYNPPKRDPGRETVRQSISTCADPKLMNAPADTQVAKTRTLESGLMSDPPATLSKPDARARICEEVDADDVFGIGIGAEACNAESGVPRVKHRMHATADIAPYRRIRARDNLKDVFEKMRPLSTQPARNGCLDVSMSRSAFEYYLEVVIASTRAREVLVGFGKRSSVGSSDGDWGEAGRVNVEELYRLVIQRSVERLVAKAENRDRSYCGREVSVWECRVRSELV